MQTLASDPWLPLIEEAGCICPEVGAPRPLGADSYLHKLRESWARSVLLQEEVPAALFLRSLCKSHPLLEILSHRVVRIPSLPPLRSLTPLLPIGERAQWALLRGGEEGKKVAQSLLPFVAFPSLWSPEKGYSEKEALWSIALLLRSFGRYIPIPRDPSPIFLGPGKGAPWGGGGGGGGEAQALLHESPPFSAAVATAGE